MLLRAWMVSVYVALAEARVAHNQNHWSRFLGQSPSCYNRPDGSFEFYLFVQQDPVRDRRLVVDHNWAYFKCPFRKDIKLHIRAWKKHGSCSRITNDRHYYEINSKLHDKYDVLKAFAKAGIYPDGNFYKVRDLEAALVRHLGAGESPMITCNYNYQHRAQQIYEVYVCLEQDTLLPFKCPGKQMFFGCNPSVVFAVFDPHNLPEAFTAPYNPHHYHHHHADDHADYYADTPTSGSGEWSATSGSDDGSSDGAWSDPASPLQSPNTHNNWWHRILSLGRSSSPPVLVPSSQPQDAERDGAEGGSEVDHSGKRKHSPHRKQQCDTSPVPDPDACRRLPSSERELAAEHGCASSSQPEDADSHSSNSDLHNADINIYTYIDMDDDDADMMETLESSLWDGNSTVESDGVCPL